MNLDGGIRPGVGGVAVKAQNHFPGSALHLLRRHPEAPVAYRIRAPSARSYPSSGRTRRSAIALSLAGSPALAVLPESVAPPLASAPGDSSPVPARRSGRHRLG